MVNIMLPLVTNKWKLYIAAVTLKAFHNLSRGWLIKQLV